VTRWVGTSGWQYDDWRVAFYPSDVPKRLWLEHYCTVFSTLENNNAFYRLPDQQTFATWRDRTPPGFVMAVKASRYLTHIKRLKDPKEPVERLMSAASGLGDKLGPILLQLPPTLRADTALLDKCLACFPNSVRIAVEARHSSWWANEIRAVLERRGAALCWADRLGRPITPLWRTADWGYLRFHEGAAQPWPSYGETALRSWVSRLDEAYGRDGDAYVYFNNDLGAAAVRDALRFRQLTHA